MDTEKKELEQEDLVLVEEEKEIQEENKQPGYWEEVKLVILALSISLVLLFIFLLVVWLLSFPSPPQKYGGFFISQFQQVLR